MIVCDKCNRTFTSSSALKAHLRRKVPCNQVFACDNCDFECTSLVPLKRHQKDCLPSNTITLDQFLVLAKNVIQKKCETDPDVSKNVVLAELHSILDGIFSKFHISQDVYTNEDQLLLRPTS